MSTDSVQIRARSSLPSILLYPEVLKCLYQQTCVPIEKIGCHLLSFRRVQQKTCPRKNKAFKPHQDIDMLSDHIVHELKSNVKIM